MAGKKIPNGFGKIENLLKRASKADQDWELWRSIHQEAFDFSAPQRNTFQIYAPGQRKNRHIFDSTAVDGLVTFANRIQGALVPSWLQWQDLVAGTDVPEEEKAVVNEKLQKETKTFFSAINHSNFSTEITPGLSDLGVGTGAIQVNEGVFGKDEHEINFSNVALADLRPETPVKGKIENVWRHQEIEVGQIKETWPLASLPAQIEQKIEKAPFEKEKVLNGFLLNQKDDLYYHLVIHKSTKHLMHVQSFKSKRLIVFRWHVTPGETFGRGPILEKMADIRTVNKVKQFILQNAAIQMSGMYTGRDDGIFNPYTAKIAPGIILPVQSNDKRNPTLRALERAGDIGLGDLVISDLQEGIKKSLLADPLGDIQDPVRTLGEQLIRMQETLKDRGASFGRLKTELIEPLVSAVVDVLQSRGKMAPIRVDGKEVTIKHTSPLAKAEDLEEFQNSQVWFSSVSALPQEVVVGSIRVEELPRYWAEKLNISLDLIRSDTERKAIGEALTELAKQGGMTGNGRTEQQPNRTT